MRIHTTAPVRLAHRGETWCNRNGTYIRILLIGSPTPAERRRFDNVDIHLERIIVLASPNLASLDEQTASLCHLAAAEGIQLVSADGHHATLLAHIVAANGGTR